MNAKKVFGFLILRSFFTSRNLTSIALVGFFMLVYILCGGKISPVPSASVPSSFGVGTLSTAPNSFQEAEPLQDETFGADALVQNQEPMAQIEHRKGTSLLSPDQKNNEGDLSDIQRQLEALGK